MTDGTYLGGSTKVHLGGQKYLDGLVIETANLKKVNEQPESLRSKLFLEMLPPDKIKDYIQDTISKKLIDSIKEGELYVFTPSHGFRYKKSGATVSTATRLNELGSEGTLDEVIRHILNSAEEAKREQRKFSINILFYDESSKTAFNAKIKPVLDESGFHELKVPGYGTVKLHNYWSPFYSKT